jgi:hypothetical protein
MSCPAAAGAPAAAGIEPSENSSDGDDDGRGSGALADAGQWAAEFAMSERNLARLVVRETG